MARSGEWEVIIPNTCRWEHHLFLPENEIDADLLIRRVFRSRDHLIEPDFVLPDSTSVTFDPSKDFVTRLPDGAEHILGGSANVDYETVDKVKLVVTPTARVSRDAIKTADYAIRLNSSMEQPVRKSKVNSSRMLSLLSLLILKHWRRMIWMSRILKVLRRN